MSEEAQAELALLVADVYELAGSLRRHGEAFAGRVGQTQARWQLLSVLSGEVATVPQVARRLGVSRQAVQRVADDLAGEGLVDFVANPHHRQSALLELTPSGHDVLGSIIHAASSWQSEVARDLDRRMLQRTRKVLRQILERIAEVEDSIGSQPEP